jgi:UDP-glucose 4-epimerase
MTAAASEPLVPRPRGTGIVFLSGAGGFIGRHAAAAFLGAGWRVAGFSYRAPSVDPTLDLAVPEHWSAGPVSREALWRAAAEIGRPELFIHAAGGATVGASLADPADDFARNVESTCEALAFLREGAPEARLVFPSSAAVYGMSEAAAIDECAPVAPMSPYGEHKLQAEKEIAAARGEWNLDAAVIRFFSVYGPGNRKQLLWEIASRLGAGAKRLELSGSGEEARDFLYIDDAVRMLGLVAGLDRAALPAVINGGTGIATTVRDAAEEMCRAFGADVEIAFTGVERPGDPKRLVASLKLARGLGFVPQMALAEGVARTALWSRSTTGSRS